MFRRKRKPSDFGAEIEAHLQLETERLREEGLCETEARAAARGFGNVSQAEERFYESGRWLFWDHLRQDLRFAFRMLRKSDLDAGLPVFIQTCCGNWEFAWPLAHSGRKCYGRRWDEPSRCSGLVLRQDCSSEF